MSLIACSLAPALRMATATPRSGILAVFASQVCQLPPWVIKRPRGVGGNPHTPGVVEVDPSAESAGGLGQTLSIGAER